MRRFFSELFSVFSRFLNVIRGGSADLTLSASAYDEGLWIEDKINWLFFFIRGEVDHCQRYWEYEVRRSREVVERAK